MPACPACCVTCDHPPNCRVASTVVHVHHPGRHRRHARRCHPPVEEHELIEYAPTTDDVDVVPVVMVSSPVNKYYLLDLASHLLVIGAELALGRRVFAVSWVNPDVSHADVGFDEYVTAILEVLATVEVVTQAGSAHLLGLCAGGQLSVMAAGYLAAVGRQDELATLTVGISVIDFGAPMASMASWIARSPAGGSARPSLRGFFDAIEILCALLRNAATERRNSGQRGQQLRAGQAATSDVGAVLGPRPDQPDGQVRRRHD